MQDELEHAIERMEDLKQDNSVPSNIRNTLDQSIEALQVEDEELSVRINTATSLLDEVSNDPNIAMHTRTEVYNIASILEQAGNSE